MPIKQKNIKNIKSRKICGTQKNEEHNIIKRVSLGKTMTTVIHFVHKHLD